MRPHPIFRYLALVILISMAGGRAWGATASEYSNAGYQYYKAKNFSQAILYFNGALNLEPNNTSALSGRANCYYYLGQYQAALADYQRIQLLVPSPQVSQFIQTLQEKITAAAPKAEPSAPAASSQVGVTFALAPKPASKFGFRFEPGMSFMSLTNFQTNGQTYQSETVAYLNSVDQKTAYSGHVPTATANLGLEAVYKLSPNLELSLPLGFIPVGTADDNFAAPDLGEIFSDSFQISVFMVGLSVRYLIGTGDFQPFVSAGPLLVPISISYTSNLTNANGVYTGSGSFSSMGFGGQAQLGLDWHIGETFVLSPFAGFQVVTASGFTSSNFSNSGNGVNVAGQNAQLEMVPTAYGSNLLAVSNGYVAQSPAGVSLPAPSGAKPLTVDLSGVNVGLHLSAFF